jgi:hypothetical protein
LSEESLKKGVAVLDHSKTTGERVFFSNTGFETAGRGTGIAESEGILANGEGLLRNSSSLGFKYGGYRRSDQYFGGESGYSVAAVRSDSRTISVAPDNAFLHRFQYRFQYSG